MRALAVRIATAALTVAAAALPIAGHVSAGRTPIRATSASQQDLGWGTAPGGDPTATPTPSPAPTGTATTDDLGWG